MVKILELNDQYDHPEVEGPDAMRRVARCEAAIFLVAVAGGKPCGLIRAVYDGARALIHLLSVHPDQQRSGIGHALVHAVNKELLQRGASGTLVTVSERSIGFWQKMNFEKLPISVMLTQFKS